MDWCEMTESAQDIHDAFDSLSTTRTALFEASEAVIDARREYEDARATIIVTTEPKTLGANDDARQAKLRELLAKQLKAIATAEAEERLARHRFEQSRDAIRRADMILRLMAVEAPERAPESEMIEF